LIGHSSTRSGAGLPRSAAPRRGVLSGRHRQLWSRHPEGGARSFRPAQDADRRPRPQGRRGGV